MRRMYSEKQIKSLAKYVAENNLTDVDLKVKTIEQSEANALFETTEAINLPDGFTLTKYYEKVEVINGVMYFVFNYLITNGSESAASLPNNWLIKYVSVGAYGQKIYRADGQNIDRVASSTSGDNYIAPLYTKYGQYQFTPSDLGAYLFQSSQNNVAIVFGSSSNISAGSSVIVSGRTFITLI